MTSILADDDAAQLFLDVVKGVFELPDGVQVFLGISGARPSPGLASARTGAFGLLVTFF